MFKRLPPEQQKAIGQMAMSEKTISHIAQHHQVSRNTVYAQQRRAQSGLFSFSSGLWSSADKGYNAYLIAPPPHETQHFTV